MARRSTDLLDVFRPGASGAATPTRASRPPRAPREPGRRFEGVFLGPRQVLLGSCVLLLTLVLAFTVGLGVGRRGRGAEPSLRRESEPVVWVLRGRVAQVDMATAAALTEERIVRELERRNRVPPSMVRVRRLPEQEAWEIAVGPFAGESEARAFILEKNLSTARVGSAAPFRLSRPEPLRVPAGR